VGQASTEILGYNLSSGGVLTPVSGGRVYTGAAVNDYSIRLTSVQVNPAGTFLYVQSYYNIFVFAIAPGTGALTLVQTVPNPTAASSFALDPAGAYLYATGLGTIVSYGINASTGMLTLTKTSSMAEQTAAYTISVSPTGQFAYTSEVNGSLIYLVAYSIYNGAFTPVGTPALGYFTLQIGVDPSGRFLYLPDSCSSTSCQSQGLLSNSVSQFSIASSGDAMLLPGSPVSSGTSPFGITITSQ
jgi:6-phosphogluconolactonase (cycloisomerase 2 family)